MRHRKIALAVICFLALSACIVPNLLLPGVRLGDASKPTPDATARTAAKPPSSITTPAKLETTAQSAVLMDMNGNILFEKDSHKPLAPASVTKVMTILLAIEALERGQVKLEEPVTTSEYAHSMGGSQIWLEVGETMTYGELLKAVAIASANDAAMAIAEYIGGSEQGFVDMMNKKATEIGCADTHFVNPTGLPAEGHKMSAYDTALIVKYAARYPKYMELVSTKEHWLRGDKTWLLNTNKLLWWYRGADGFKTGWTEEAQYCFAGTALRDNLRLVAVVFATPEPRSHFREAMKLLDFGFNTYTGYTAVQKAEVIDKIRIHKGIEKEVDAIAADSLVLTMPKGKTKGIEKKFIPLEQKMVAPVGNGQKVGELAILKDGVELGRVEVVTAKEVLQAGFFRMLQDTISDLFTFKKK
jgi:serine-type D-Ala-D-Ala carboxypeptidase (penicillin-binding protein 5/6)